VPAYVTVAAAAETLGVKRRTIWRLINQGQLRAIANPIDRRAKLVSQEDVEKLAVPGIKGPMGDGSHYPWPSTVGAADLGVSSDEVEEWLEANWRPR